MNRFRLFRIKRLEAKRLEIRKELVYYIDNEHLITSYGSGWLKNYLSNELFNVERKLEKLSRRTKK